VNFLLEHLQHVTGGIARAEIAKDIAQKLDIDSAALNQAMRYAAASRATAVKISRDAPATESERILIRTLAITADQLEPLPDLRHQAQYTMSQEQLHRGLPTEALLDALLQADAENLDPLALELPEPERRLLAEIMMKDEEPLTEELIHGALEALRRRHLERRQQQVRARIAEAERKNDSAALAQALQEKVRIDRELASQ
jgi:hypothetical protein